MNVTTPEVVVKANPDDVARGRAERWLRDFGTESNDATSVAGGRKQNSHLDEWGIEGAAKAAAWAKDHPILNNVGLGLSTIPLAVAATPAVIGGGELTAAALTNPYVDAAITSVFGAHGIQSLMNGTANWGTAFELAPLGRLAKPVFKAGVKTLDRVFPMPDLKMPARRVGLNIPAQDAGLFDQAATIENEVPDLLSIAQKNTAKRDFENRFVTPGF